MNLHHDTQLFSQTLRAASQHLKINLGFVEKDYWITLVLQRLSGSKYIDAYQLHPFEINILNKEQTLLEKLVSLIRFSLAQDPILSVSSKIRHFYDLYYLAKDDDCIKCIQSDTFKQQFFALLEHDKELFDEPKGWGAKSIGESPLIINFDSLWKIIKGQYQSELSALAYRSIPDEKDVALSFIRLSQRLL